MALDRWTDYPTFELSCCWCLFMVSGGDELRLTLIIRKDLISTYFFETLYDILDTYRVFRPNNEA